MSYRIKDIKSRVNYYCVEEDSYILILDNDKYKFYSAYDFLHHNEYPDNHLIEYYWIRRGIESCFKSILSYLEAKENDIEFAINFYNNINNFISIKKLMGKEFGEYVLNEYPDLYLGNLSINESDTNGCKFEIKHLIKLKSKDFKIIDVIDSTTISKNDKDLYRIDSSEIDNKLLEIASKTKKEYISHFKNYFYNFSLLKKLENNEFG